MANRGTVHRSSWEKSHSYVEDSVRLTNLTGQQTKQWFHMCMACWTNELTETAHRSMSELPRSPNAAWGIFHERHARGISSWVGPHLLHPLESPKTIKNRTGYAGHRKKWQQHILVRVNTTALSQNDEFGRTGGKIDVTGKEKTMEDGPRSRVQEQYSGEKTHTDGDVWLLKLHAVRGLFSVSCDILSK